MINKKPFVDSLGVMVIEMDEGSSLKDIYEYVSTDKEGLHMYLLKRISYGIRNNLRSVRIFRVYGSDYYLDCPRKDWKNYLNKALDYFIEIENYELCETVVKATKKLEPKKRKKRKPKSKKNEVKSSKIQQPK